MSYQVLARKWRPRSFSEMVGQEHVVRALGNALDHDRLHHAYLFTGTRGVGKTTLARIFAKSLNCERGVSASPCGQCSNCVSIDQGRFVDLLEIDAASYTGVDNIREVLESAQYAPTSGSYKVYLIDEVHMLSKNAFNALLKTLEEPPDHVKFLLATTDPQKVPVTVLSRCLQFNLKQLPLELIRGQMEHILGQEGVQYELPGLTLIARAAAGSMRDGLSLLDQAIAFGAGQVLEADVRAMLGVLPQERLYRVLTALADNDGVALLDAIAELTSHAPDFAAVLQGLLLLLHRTALGQLLPEALSEQDADVEQVRALARRMTPEDVQLYYQIGLVGQRDLPYAPDPRSGLEMVLLRMLVFRPESGSPAPAAPQGGGGIQVTKPIPPPRRPEPVTAAKPAEPAPVAPAKPGDRDWHQVTAAIAASLGGMATQLAENCVVQSWSGDQLTLTQLPGTSQLASERSIQRLQQALSGYYGREIRLRLRPAGDEDPRQQAPAERKAEQRAERQRQAEQSLRADPYVQALTEQFEGVLISESIKPLD